MSLAASHFVSVTELGARIVVRTRIEGGVTDAVGYLRACTDTECTVETKRGLVTLALADIVAAKQVPPPPPAPRAPRRPLAD
ncbi:ferrous iron transport protein A [Cryobacterium sp. TMT1-21]|uniref:putative acetyltransferase n=1 Tax=Cryobacterium sp. TMT1-21 TaxID=1259234 RepID=UPI00106D54F2|nr:ferrous iron transport protein A [Cryobacterium sp. TMT1-21]TFD16665.1 ferrous iron transport protein A [Cryobacterium sp. TMT1-21]